MKRFVKEYATFVMNETIDSTRHNKAVNVLRNYQHSLINEYQAMQALAILHEEIVNAEWELLAMR